MQARQALKAVQAKLAAESKHERAAIAQVRARAVSQQRAAVRTATARVRAQARIRQAKAVKSAVNQAQRDATAASASSSSASTSTDPRFSYCYQANDAGYGPYTQGVDPEYDWYNDNNSDGVVCEQ